MQSRVDSSEGEREETERQKETRDNRNILPSTPLTPPPKTAQSPKKYPVQTSLNYKNIVMGVTRYISKTHFASNISATISQGMGPSPISKKVTKAITPNTAARFGRNPSSDSVTTTVDASIPPALHRIRGTLPVLSISCSAT